MLFKKEFLQNIEDNEDVEIISTTLEDNGRWSLFYKRIFKFEDKFYETYFSRGATECQDESPYEYDDDEIDCAEVFPVEKTIIVYEIKK
jgi:hypothetical protein